MFLIALEVIKFKTAINNRIIVKMANLRRNAVQNDSDMELIALGSGSGQTNVHCRTEIPTYNLLELSAPQISRSQSGCDCVYFEIKQADGLIRLMESLLRTAEQYNTFSFTDSFDDNDNEDSPVHFQVSLFSSSLSDDHDARLSFHFAPTNTRLSTPVKMLDPKHSRVTYTDPFTSEIRFVCTILSAVEQLEVLLRKVSMWREAWSMEAVQIVADIINGKCIALDIS